MTAEHQLRASDADRQQVIAALERHTSAGRLDLEEYSERVDRVLRARTHGELAAIVVDLPAEPATGPPADRRTSARQLLLAFLVALLALLLIGAAVAAFR